MKIKNVKIHQPTPEEAGGLVIPPVFMVDYDNGETASVPHDPRNRDYMEIQVWYDRKKNKPFEFDFKNAVIPKSSNKK